MGKFFYIASIFFTLACLIALPAFACSNHPPQKSSAGSTSESAGWVPSGSVSEESTLVGAKIVKATKGTDSGKKAWSNSFFGGAPRTPTTSPDVTVSPDSWSSDIE